jgi:hypothetical protein
MLSLDTVPPASSFASFGIACFVPASPGFASAKASLAFVVPEVFFALVVSFLLRIFGVLRFFRGLRIFGFTL